MIPQQALDAAYEQVSRVRKVLKKSTSRQVDSAEERSLAKSTSQTWFNDYLPIIATEVHEQEVAEVSAYFRQLLDFSDRSTTRAKYDALLKDLTKSLGKFRVDFVSGSVQGIVVQTDDKAPDFSPLTPDKRMQEILAARWSECSMCVHANAPLAATVMMGGMLEALLMARVNAEPDKAKIFKSTHIPVDKKLGKQIPVQEWMLRTYIDVAHDMRWITQSAKDIGAVLRDYRNYIHPQKQYSHNVELGDGDALLFWQLTKSIARQLIK